MSITIEHVLQACDWAAKHRDTASALVPGINRKYDQASWDCGTTCCVWGAASILAGLGPANCGPDDDSLGDSPEARIAIRLMRNPHSAPEHIAAALRGDCDADGNWQCLNCSGCSYCFGCSNCSGCSYCFGCSNCSDCSYCSHCSHCYLCHNKHQ